MRRYKGALIYEPELLKAKQDIFGIDKVIRRDYKKKQVLVKFLDYSDDLRVSLPKIRPLRFGLENQFPLNFGHEYILVQK